MRTDFRNIDELMYESQKALDFYNVEVHGISAFKVDDGMFKLVIVTACKVVSFVGDNMANLVIELAETMRVNKSYYSLESMNPVRTRKNGVSKEFV